MKSMKKLQSRLGAILAIAALWGAGLTGCPLESPPEPENDGLGRVTIGLGDAVERASRSIFPGKTGLVYEYIFTNDSGQSQTLTPDTSGGGNSFRLEYGQWNVEVKAYAGSVGYYNLAARGEKSFTVSSTPQTVDVVLTGEAQSGSGTFKYKIQYPAGAEIKSFTIKQLPSGSLYGVSYTSGTTEISGSQSYNAGFYLVSVMAERPNGGVSGRNEIVHIYNNLTTEFGTDSAPIVLTADDFTAIPLAANVFADGAIADYGGRQWFSFTATADPQYIHANFNGSMTDLYAQLYDSTGAEVGSDHYLGRNYDTSASQTVTAGQRYFIRVRSNSSTGAYQIGFTSSTASPPITLPTSGFIPLTENVFTDGNTAAASTGIEWFRFTATAATQYLHVDFPSGVGAVYVQLYDNAGNAVGSQEVMATYQLTTRSWTVTASQTYVIRIPHSGYAYRIGYTQSATPPPIPLPSGFTQLTENLWGDGNIPTLSGVEWFRFTATADTQYLHGYFGSLTGLYIQLYDDSGNAVGTPSQFYGSTLVITLTVTNTSTYYIKAYPMGYTPGTYKIAFNTFNTAPPAIPMPPSSVTAIAAADQWTASVMTASDDEQWFSFTASADPQYIHFDLGPSSRISANPFQVYDASGNAVGSPSSTAYASSPRTVTPGSTYYVRLWTSAGPGDTTYSICFSDSGTPPPITLPGSGVIDLALNTWADGNISSLGEQWFRFTATATPQYIHSDLGTAAGTLRNAWFQVYDNTGVALSPRHYMNTTYSLQETVTVSSDYYIKVLGYGSYTGTYRIAFNDSATAP